MGKYVCINLVWLRKYPADAKPDKLLKGFFWWCCHWATYSQIHISKSILWLFRYLQMWIVLTIEKPPIVQFLTWLVILGSISTGSQQTGFLNALKDSPARYPFIETYCRFCCKITWDGFACFLAMVECVLLDFIT